LTEGPSGAGTPEKKGRAVVFFLIALALFVAGIAGQFALPDSVWPRVAVLIALLFNTVGLLLRVRERRGPH
jgi:protein-S-isoprenylcysteine O-methyltransferase Ste14